MDPGLLGAVIGAGVAVVISSGGGLIKWIRSLYTLIKTQEATIADLREQRNMLKVSAEIQDKLLDELRPHVQRDPRGDRT